MRRKQALPALTALAGTVTVFVAVEPQQGEAVLAKPESADVALLGSLKGRAHSVRIESVDGSPAYTVLDANGRILADRLELDELAEQYPMLAPGAFYADDQHAPLGPLMIVPDRQPF